MDSNDQSIRVTVDSSEFLEALRLMLSRRNVAPAGVREEIDRAIARLDAGDVAADQLRVCWHETTRDGDTIVHITAGAALLDLALPSGTVDTD